jgi:hypothetical protein
VVIPASSLIRKSLNLSLRLFLVDRLLPLLSDSCPSSNLLNIISGLLFNVVIEEAVFLRSPLLGAGNGGDWTVSFVEDPRESHANGLVSFLVGTTGVGRVALLGAGGAAGGAPQGTEGRTPDKPCSDGFVDRGGGGGGVFSRVAISDTIIGA